MLSRGSQQAVNNSGGGKETPISRQGAPGKKSPGYPGRRKAPARRAHEPIGFGLSETPSNPRKDAVSGWSPCLALRRLVFGELRKQRLIFLSGSSSRMRGRSSGQMGGMGQ